MECPDNYGSCGRHGSANGLVQTSFCHGWMEMGASLWQVWTCLNMRPFKSDAMLMPVLLMAVNLLRLNAILLNTINDVWHFESRIPDKKTIFYAWCSLYIKKIIPNIFRLLKNGRRNLLEWMLLFLAWKNSCLRICHVFHFPKTGWNQRSVQVGKC